jgi:hypothetical protein
VESEDYDSSWARNGAVWAWNHAAK